MPTRGQSIDNTLIAAWPDLNKKFCEALEHIDEAVRRVHRLATLSRIGDDYHKKQKIDDYFLSTMDSTISFAAEKTLKDV